MLVLSRKESESICIGNGIEVLVVTVKSGRVRLGITAPREIQVMRKEIVSRESTRGNTPSLASCVKEEIQ